MNRLLAIATLVITQFSTAHAQPPRVLTDIAPIHSLASIVMQGVGTPGVLLPPGASPHDFALRPSNAREVSRADVVIWIGADFTPWLERSIESLAPDARSLQLIDVPGTFTLPYRKGAIFGHQDTDEDAHHDGGKEHDDHDHGDGDHADHAPSATVTAEANHKGHAHHGDIELHAWQEPENAKTWMDAIATLLADADPENAAAYRENAEAAGEDIDQLTADLRDMLRPLHDRGFIVMHDAYHYFEHRFDVEAAGAILPGDGGQASAARMQVISERIRELGTTCIFIEPQMSDRLARTLASEHDARIGTLDPIGDSLQRGPGLYSAMMRAIGQGLLDCLG